MTFQYYASHPGPTYPEEPRVKYILENDIRIMISAAAWGNPFTAYAVDNGAWSDYVKKRSFNHKQFQRTLEKIRKQDRQPDFIVLPDIVKGGKKSLDLSKSYLGITKEFPCYLAIQDGITPDMLTADIIESVNGLFIGGSDLWKWRNMETWVNLAHQHGKKLHVGRIGMLKDFQKCHKLAVDSADGSALVRNQKITEIGHYFKVIKQQATLTEV